VEGVAMTVRAPAHLLAITIDTEEEGRWGGGYPRDGQTCANIRWLEKLEPLRREYGLRATYLVTDPVVRDAEARDRVAAFVAEERSEIGAHLHPWCTPPYDEIDRTVTYAGNLPGPLLRAKLGGLTETIEKAFGVRPLSYRAGRWGISASTLAALEDLGYQVDSSVVPLHWEYGNGGPSSLSAPAVPYRPGPDDPMRPGQARILEVPASVVMTGPLGAPAGFIARRLRPFPGFGRILDALGRCWLRPSWGDPAVLRRATRRCLAEGHPVINVMFHSSELMPGASPYVRDAAGLELFVARLRAIVETALETSDVRWATLTEVRTAVLGEGADAWAR
jgi:peptidoglycan/xylan/chitin deacetylase (PgdA/CDA1 family)